MSNNYKQELDDWLRNGDQNRMIRWQDILAICIYKYKNDTKSLPSGVTLDVFSAQLARDIIIEEEKKGSQYSDHDLDDKIHNMFTAKREEYLVDA